MRRVSEICFVCTSLTDVPVHAKWSIPEDGVVALLEGGDGLDHRLRVLTLVFFQNPNADGENEWDITRQQQTRRHIAHSKIRRVVS